MSAWLLPLDVAAREVRECGPLIGGTLTAIVLMRAIAWLIVWVENDPNPPRPSNDPA